MYGALFQSSQRTREIHHAALRFSPRLIYSTATVRRVVASALGAFPQPLAEEVGGFQRSAHHVVERSTYAASDCRVFV